MRSDFYGLYSFYFGCCENAGKRHRMHIALVSNWSQTYDFMNARLLSLTQSKPTQIVYIEMEEMDST